MGKAQFGSLDGRVTQRSAARLVLKPETPKPDTFRTPSIGSNKAMAPLSTQGALEEASEGAVLIPPESAIDIRGVIGIDNAERMASQRRGGFIDAAVRME